MTHRAWVGLVLLLTVSSLACVGLGYWQWARHAERAAQVAIITTNLEAAPVPAQDLLGPDARTPVAPNDVWRRAELTGEWVPGSGVQLRNRPVDGANASHALGLLRTPSGTIVAVDRGWWRQGDAVPPGALDLPPGQEEIVVRLRAAEPRDPRTPPPGQAYSVTPEALLDSLVAAGHLTEGEALALAPELAAGTYGIQVEPVPTAPLAPLPSPDTGLRSHLSYAFQWWFFALAIPVAGVVLVRRDRDDDDDAPRPARTRRRPTLAEEEDALLDATAPRVEAQARETSSA